MPVNPPFSVAPAHNALFPALYLYPLNDTWAPKHITLTAAHTKIGRQTSSKTAPGERNGFFDSKVLSRQHAEVWEEGGKIFIKDVKSSNGTFINGERLSSEGHESEPFELKSDDIVEFGIDIVGEDNKTIIHHKVAARVVCVFTEQDAAVAARAEQHQAAAAAQHAQQQQHQHLSLTPHHQQQQHLHHQQQQQLHQAGLVGIPPPGPHGYLNPNSGLGIGAAAGAVGFPFSGSPSANSSVAGGPNGAPQARRPMAHHGLGGMGGPPPLNRAPGKTQSGLSFDVILSRLQGEVQKSRETGAELGGLAGLMGDVEGVLGGRGPPNLQAFPSHLPPVRPPTEAPQPPPTGPIPPPPGAPAAAAVSPAGESSASSSAAPQVNGTSSPEGLASTSTLTVSALQAQLAETQASLAAHLERVRALEGVLKEQEAIKHEVGLLRGLVEGRRAGESTSAHEEVEQKSRSPELPMEIRYEPEELSLLERDENEQITLGLEDVLEEDEDDDDDEDDRRSVNTVIPHELERVDEEDEESLLEDERASQASDREREQRGNAEEEEEDHFRAAVPQQHEGQSAFDHERDEDEREETQQEIDEQERRRVEDLGVGRPRTPEPSRLGMVAVRERRSAGSPLSTVSPNSIPPAATTDDVHAQVERLAAQVGAVLALTNALEKQHSSAQSTIRDLEDKVHSLEGMLDQSRKRSASQKSEEDDDDDDDDAELPSALVAWTRTLAGQWSSLQADWMGERMALAQAKEEWEARALRLDNGLSSLDSGLSRLDGGLTRLDMGLGKVEGALARVEKGDGAVAGLLSAQERVREAVREQGGRLEAHLAAYQAHVHESHNAHWGGANGDAVKQRSNGGLVTPPSPRSQSSDSARYRRRRRRSSGARRGSKEREGESEEEEEEEDSKHGIRHALGLVASTASAVVGVSSLATPANSVYGLPGVDIPSDDPLAMETKPAVDASDDVKPLNGHAKENGVLTAPTTRANSSAISEADSLDGSLDAILVKAETALEERLAGKGKRSPGSVHMNMHTAVGVVLLSVAAAAVFWKVKPE